MSEPRLHGVLVTFRRPKDLERSLRSLADQDRRLDTLVVVDNAPTGETESIVRAVAGAAGEVSYLPMTENVGFPGALAAGMASLIEGSADDRDWIVVLDDDDPPEQTNAFEDLVRFAEETAAGDPRTAAVGLRGARFDDRKGLLLRVATRDITGPAVPVDYIAGNALPLYRVRALRDVGTFAAPLFFSHEELELGLRLKRAGFALYCHGDRWRARRADNGRPDVLEEERWRLLQPNWRSYYSLRNTIHILRENGGSGAALRITISRGLLKPLAHLAVSPRSASRALRLNVRACADAWRGRLGRRIDPDVSARPKRAPAPAPSSRA
ncbi:MAG: glycosyltransferase family 2 protein [Actinomycetota bacterium]